MSLTALPLRRRVRRFALRTLLAIACLLTPLVVAAPPAAASLPARTATESSIAWAVKSLIVAERSWHGVPYIYMSSQLQLSARRHDVTMARYNTLSHQLPGEPWFGTRFTQAYYYWSYAGENIAWTSTMTKDGALALERMMYNERYPYDEHRRNILNWHYRNVGVDVYLDWTHHKLWLTTDFGHRR